MMRTIRINITCEDQSIIVVEKEVYLGGDLLNSYIINTLKEITDKGCTYNEVRDDKHEIISCNWVGQKIIVGIEILVVDNSVKS